MKQFKCEVCQDTGYYGDNGPGIRGNNEYQLCDTDVHYRARETTGDQNSIPCPECGQRIRNLPEYGNMLAEGLEFECPACGCKLAVVSIDTTTVITLSRSDA